MASNLDYLSPDLLPLEEKVQAYLNAEEEIRKATLEAHNEASHQTEPSQTVREFSQHPSSSSNDQYQNITQRLQAMRDDLATLHAELLNLLPTRDEWVKVNLGYGPSRVGAWHVPATDAAPEHYQVRVVH